MYKHLTTIAIGGLENIGYSGDNLVVLSRQGRGVFDCITGERIYRDDVEWSNEFDENDCSIKSFGPLVAGSVSVFGVHNTQSFNTNNNSMGLSLIATDPEPDEPPFQKFLIRKVFLVDLQSNERTYISSDGACELRTFGFSETGNSFVIASSCDVVIWVRE